MSARNSKSFRPVRMPSGITKGEDEIADQKTQPPACALLRTILCGEPDNAVDPAAAQRFVTLERALVTLFHLKTGGENKGIFDCHGGPLPGVRADGMGGIAHQNDRTFVPGWERRHVVDRIAALDPLDMIEDLGVGARVIDMQGTDFPCVDGWIGDLVNLVLVGSIGIEPIDRLPGWFEIAKKRIVTESVNGGVKVGQRGVAKPGHFAAWA